MYDICQKHSQPNCERLNMLVTQNLKSIKLKVFSHIIESVDYHSISRDGQDTPIILYVIHYKKSNISVQVNYEAFQLSQSDLGQIPHISISRTFTKTLVLVRTRRVENSRLSIFFQTLIGIVYLITAFRVV
jgi:hypothetical protein